MTKQKKAIWVILGIIIFVFSVFLGLGYLGQITGGNSLIQRTEMNDKYVPEEITKYYPIENLNSKENLLSDENYANSIQDALLSASIEFEQGEEYKAHIDKVIKEFENENYRVLIFFGRLHLLVGSCSPDYIPEETLRRLPDAYCLLLRYLQTCLPFLREKAD